jgi:dolichol-phosphate mannosyltransferase
MPEHDRFVRGMFGWMGYRQAAVPFHRDERAAGSTQYSLKKMLRLACDGIVGFSDVPLRLALWAGAIVSFAALSYGFVVLVLALVTANTGFVHGWASTIVVLSFIAGVNLITTGIVGLYVGRIHSEVKRRPLYVVGRVEGFGADVPASLRTAGDERAAGPESVPADRAKLGGTGGSAGGAGRVLPVARRSVGSGTT